MTKTPDINALSAVLERFGATAERWPADIRTELVTLTENNPDAARALGEAQALDRLLGEADIGLVGDGAAERVLQATMSRLHHEQGAVVVDLESRRRAAAERTSERNPGVAAGPLGRASWLKVGTMLAASLMAGFAIGASGVSERTIEPIAVLASGTSDDGDLGFFGLISEPNAGEELL